jgi:predicted nucleotidyltransferase
LVELSRQLANRLAKLNSREAILREKRLIGRKVARQLKKDLGANVLAIGFIGSVARGTAERFSDVDLFIVLRKSAEITGTYMIVNNTYCSLNFETWKSAISKLREPHPELPEILGGFTKILGVYDPGGLMPQFEEEARQVSSSVFLKSAELALIHSFEDFCRAKKAFLNKDDVVLKDNVHNVTLSASNVVAALNGYGFASDREIFKVYKKFRKVPRNFSKIQALRYGDLSTPRLFKTLMQFYVNLVDFCKQVGVHFPVELDAIERLT